MLHNIKRISLVLLSTGICLTISANIDNPLLSKIPLAELNKRREKLINKKEETLKRSLDEELNKKIIAYGPFSISRKTSIYAASAAAFSVLLGISLGIDYQYGTLDKRYPFSVMGIPLAILGPFCTYEALMPISADVSEINNELKAIDREINERHTICRKKLKADLDQWYIDRN